MRGFANLHEFFVHHDDVRGANGCRPRTLSRNVTRAPARLPLAGGAAPDSTSSGQEKTRSSEHGRGNRQLASPGFPASYSLTALELLGEIVSGDGYRAHRVRRHRFLVPFSSNHWPGWRVSALACFRRGAVKQSAAGLAWPLRGQA